MKSLVPKHILVLSLSGIGNFLMHLPTLKTLKESYPESHITIAIAPRGTRELAQHSHYIDHVIELKLKQSFRDHLKAIHHLRKQKFDTAFMLSPGQLIKGALYMFLANIPKRIAHEYPLLGSASHSFLLTHSIPENQHIHDIAKNLELLKLINLKPDLNQKYSLDISISDQKNNLLNQINIGFHMGSSTGFEWKRWPQEYFIELGKELISKHKAHIFLFGGKEEEKLKQAVAQHLKSDATVIPVQSLVTTAQYIKKCRVFISNDSGLMHLAAALGVKTYGLFGPTDEKQVGPHGLHSYTIRAAGTHPVYNTEKRQNLGNTAHASLIQLKPIDVLNRIVV